jgi:hypothetical protein
LYVFLATFFFGDLSFVRSSLHMNNLACTLTFFFFHMCTLFIDSRLEGALFFSLHLPIL